jgi:hypothetical protein
VAIKFYWQNMGYIINLFEFYFKSYGFYSFQIKSFIPVFIANQKEIERDFSFKILNSADVSYLEQTAIAPNYVSSYSNRLKADSGFLCFALIDIKTNQLAYYSWINSNNNYLVKEINQIFDFKETNSVLLEGDYTFESFRGRGLHTYVMQKRLEYCCQNKIEQAFIAIHFRNKAALRVVKKFGFKQKILIPIYYRSGTVTYTIKKIAKRINGIFRN